MSIRKRKRIISIILSVIILVVMGAVYAYGVYHGYFLLNNPSRRTYPVRGVDVAHYQGEIDWQILAGEGIDFAYMKATEGSSHVDRKFADNWAAAGKTDLKVGAYHFFSFDSPGDTQAANFIAQVPDQDGMLPPVVDVEYYGGKKTDPPEGEAVRAELRSMLDILEKHYGRKPVIYTTEEVWNAYLKGYYEEYPLWIRNVFTKPAIKEPWVFWQFSNRGRLDGYSGVEEFIDLNVFNGSREEWEDWMEQR